MSQKGLPVRQAGLAPIFILVGILVLTVIASGAFYLSRPTNPKPSSTPIVSQIPQPNSNLDNAKEYITYEFDTYHIGTPVFQVQIPHDWSAYSIWISIQQGGTQVVHFGPSHYEIQPGIVGDMESLIEIHLTKNPNLSLQNIESWPSDKSLNIIGAGAQFNWSDTTVNSLPAKVGSFGGISCNERFVLLIQNNLIFSFHVPICGDEKTDPLLPVFNHILSTFKILNPDPVGL